MGLGSKITIKLDALAQGSIEWTYLDCQILVI